jgi:hypothetical protein
MTHARLDLFDPTPTLEKRLAPNRNGRQPS